MASVQDILDIKGDAVHTIEEAATVLDATVRMNQQQVGALVVLAEADRVVGIFTERDVLRRIVADGRDPVTTDVASVMTDKVICCQPSTSLDDVQCLMRNQHIRHLPVIDDGTLGGIVSIGDVVKGVISEQEALIIQLEQYITS